MTIDEIISRLTEPVADRHIKTRKQGGNTIHYIEWHTACSYLDAVVPNWSWIIHSVSEVGGLVVVHGSLTLQATDATAVRHATGIEDPSSKGYGDPVSNASAMAFKRAAAMFGLGRHLYQKDGPVAVVPQQYGEPKPAKNPDWFDALTEHIHTLQLYGITMSEMQNRIFKVAGVKTRAELNNGTGIAVLRDFEEWVMEEETKAVAHGNPAPLLGEPF